MYFCIEFFKQNKISFIFIFEFKLINIVMLILQLKIVLHVNLHAKPVLIQPLVKLVLEAKLSIRIFAKVHVQLIIIIIK
jgi:hypothetical protein